MHSRIWTPSSDLPASADLVVIGGGIVGAATAFFASRTGLQVVVLERRAGLATLNTTRSLEAFRAQFDDPDDIAMMLESIRIFEHFAEVIEVPGYDVSLHQQGYLFVTQADDGLERVQARVKGQRAAGLADVECLDGAEARRRFPYLADDVTAAAFRAGDGWIASHEVTYGFARASGARFCLETEARGFELAGGHIAAVITDRGAIATPRAAIAAGPYSARLAATVGLALPITPVRRHRGGIKAHPLIPRSAPMTLSLETGAHFRPEGPGAYLGWSGALEEPAAEPLDEVPIDWTFPALAIDAAARFAPFWNAIADSLTHENVTLQAGQYDLTPDAKPLLGASGVDGLWLNTGYSGHGVMGSPAGARLVTDLITGKVAEKDNPFAVSRFAAGRAASKKPL